jgi:hypothetical protein
MKAFERTFGAAAIAIASAAPVLAAAPAPADDPADCSRAVAAARRQGRVLVSIAATLDPSRQHAFIADWNGSIPRGSAR